MTELDTRFLTRKRLVSALQKLGELGHITPDLRRSLSGLEGSGINRERPEFWDNIAARLDQQDLINLFKGLVIAERDLRITGGSVSGTIPLFRKISRSVSLDDAYDLAAWALDTSPNDFTPFGFRNGAHILHSYRPHILTGEFRSFPEAYGSAVAIDQRQRQTAYELRLEEERRQTLQRRSEKAEQNRLKQLRHAERSQYRLTQISVAAELPLRERMVWLAETDLPLPAIPPVLFDLSSISRLDLGKELRSVLISRLGSHKRHWRKLADVLRAPPVADNAT